MKDAEIEKLKSLMNNAEIISCGTLLLECDVCESMQITRFNVKRINNDISLLTAQCTCCTNTSKKTINANDIF